MTISQIKLLSTMKKMVYEGKRKFQSRKDRDYVEALLELGITEEEAWNIVLTLNCNFYFPDPKPEYSKYGESLTFKRQVNGILAYIKLKIEEDGGEDKTICLSFHKDI